MIEERLKRLIEFKTISGNRDEIKQCLNWITSELASLPLRIKQEEHNGVASLIITTQKTKSPKVWLAAHVDVVPAHEVQFQAVKKDSKLFGRGSFDMKFAVACYIELLHALKDQLSALDLGIMLTSDEEVGGLSGTAYLLEEGYTSDVVVLPDSANNWKFEYAAKGVWWVTIRSTGKSSHASRPWLGDNAIDSLINYLTELKQLPLFQGSPEETYELPTINIGRINGGEATNQLASAAEANLDIRYAHEDDRQEIETQASQIAKKFKNIEIQTNVLAKAYEFDPGSRYFNTFAKIAQNKFGINIGNARAYGSTDARFFADHNIPTLVISPTGGHHHHPDEWIDIGDVEKFYGVLKEFVESVARI